MERAHRLLRLARLRNDLAAIAILEGRREYTPEPEGTYIYLPAFHTAPGHRVSTHPRDCQLCQRQGWTEGERRMMWGDR